MAHPCIRIINNSLLDILQFKNNLKNEFKKTKNIILIYTIGIYCMSRKK